MNVCVRLVKFITKVLSQCAFEVPGAAGQKQKEYETISKYGGVISVRWNRFRLSLPYPCSRYSANSSNIIYMKRPVSELVPVFESLRVWSSEGMCGPRAPTLLNERITILKCAGRRDLSFG
ncbi:hypothetical protein EVAR_51018_1 [Eumeta japonica]|uniref:Uncharacterized protein n=1 Tax=Eumeta variegata TaxID=151549 RepID=A0A4C1Y835_EUMVA|nr:hypothetical protein EVAR_51018_1 [Eumeta japonica]